MKTSIAIAAVAASAATAAGAAVAPLVPPAYRPALPPAHHAGDVTYISGGLTRAEAESVRRAAQAFPLELVFRERDGARVRGLTDMPVTITDAQGRVVFDRPSHGPYLVASLPDGRYTVTTQWDRWTFSKPVTIGKQRQRVVFEWRRPALAEAAVG